MWSLEPARAQLAADTDIQKSFMAVGARGLSSTPGQAIAYAARERAMWKDVLALAGLKPQ